MKKYILTSFFILLAIGFLGYLLSSYFLKELDQNIILRYKTLALTNKIQEMRYHLMAIHEELWVLRYVKYDPDRITDELIHSHVEMQNTATLLSALRDNEKILKTYALHVEQLEKALNKFTEKMQRISEMEDPRLRNERLDEALAFGESAEYMLASMERPLDTEIEILSNGIGSIQADLKFYRTVLLTAVFIFLLLFVLIYMTHTRSRIRKILLIVRTIREGNDVSDLSLRNNDRELQEIISELDALTGKISQNEKNLEQLTVVDPLTCVYNRRYFQDRLKEEFKRFIRYNTLFSIAIIDVDYFKKINDTYGHPMGDVVLKDIARILKENSRETDIVARVGGEEFVILYTCTDKVGSQIHLERLRIAIENHPFPDIPQNVTVSIGVSDATGKIAAEDVLRDADSALYSAKRGGRNRSVVYSSPITGNSLSKDPLSISGS